MSWQSPITVQNYSDENMSPWRYQSPSSYFIPSLTGGHSIYQEGGYSVLLSNKDPIVDVNRSLAALRAAHWVDNNTSVVFVEFTVYNPAIGLFTNVVLLFEFVEVGTVDPSFQMYTTRLYMMLNLKDIGLALCGIVSYVLIMLRAWRVWHIVPQRWRQGHAWPHPSLLTEIAVILVANGAIVLYLLRHVSVSKTSANIKRLGDSGFVNFYAIVTLDKLLTYALALELSVACVNALKLLDLNIRMLVMSETMRSAFRQLMNIATWVVAVVTAFVIVTISTLGPSCRNYSKVSMALLSVCSLCLFEPKYGNDCDTHNLTGQVFIAVASMCLVVFGRPFLCVMFIHARFEAIFNINQLSKRGDEFLDFVWRHLDVWFGWWSVKQHKKFLEAQKALHAKADRVAAASSMRIRSQRWAPHE